jgi:hypothetical protein
MERLYLDRLLALTPPAPKILDLGCGTGLPVDKYLADRGAGLTGRKLGRAEGARGGRGLDPPCARFWEGHRVNREGAWRRRWDGAPHSPGDEGHSGVVRLSSASGTQESLQQRPPADVTG